MLFRSVVVLADAWLAGAIASKKACIRKPDDIKGLKVRSAGPTFAAMWQAAGASIVSVPSNEVYNALQTGVAEPEDDEVIQKRMFPLPAAVSMVLKGTIRDAKTISSVLWLDRVWEKSGKNGLLK